VSPLHDLTITLSPPPDDAPPEVLAAFTLHSDAFGPGAGGGLLTDPLTTPERADLRWYLEEYWQWPFAEFLTRGKQVEQLLPTVGKRFYATLTSTVETDRIVQAWCQKVDLPRQVSIVGDVPRALSLPWELLHDAQGFLALRTRNPVAIVRQLPQSESSTYLASFKPPLRILLVTARPDDAGFVDPRTIARELVGALASQVQAGAVVLEHLRPPTFRALQERLSQDPPVHVLHFDGHGAFDQASGKGILAFEHDDGRLHPVSAEDLRQVLQDSGVQLAVLTACQSALGAADDAFSSVATQLIAGGVHAVIAMSASVLVVTAAVYAEAFYRELAGGATVPVAQERARQALHAKPERHVLRRGPADEGQPVQLRDWWLPHFYQQRPLHLQPEGKPPARPKKQRAAPPALLNADMPAPPRYRFSGRALELQRLERWLLQGRLAVIHGFGGMGKTALAREAAAWWTQTGLFAGACFVPFEQGGSTVTLLSALGHYLGLAEAGYDPHDRLGALAQLEPVLRQRRTLLIADNLETIMPKGEAVLAEDKRRQLWDTLLALSAAGTGVILTTRDVAFGDGRLAPGDRVAFLELDGLHPDDAYELAGRLLRALDIDRARAPYAALREFLALLDHQPLAIQLVLPLLRNLSLHRLRAEFADLLPQFTDDTETGRNRSLLASLEYSLRRLTGEQRALLPRLAPFEGGASQDDLLAIAEIPAEAWASLRQALEQAALVSVERVHEDVTVPFLHFHPVLAPFLRRLPGADDPVLQDRFARRYYAAANYYYREDNRRPHCVRAVVQRELPNLRRALSLLLAADGRDAAADMAKSMAMFLQYFGLGQETDAMQRRVEAMIRAPGVPAASALTEAERLHESAQAERELDQGRTDAARARLERLLGRVEAGPKGAGYGRGSFAHCMVLTRLGCTNQLSGRPRLAERQLREALAIIDALLAQTPDDVDRQRHRAVVLTDLGDAYRDQGKYAEARHAYEEDLQLSHRLGDKRGAGVTSGQLGMLALAEGDFPAARTLYRQALMLFQGLQEPAMEAVAWHQLGMVAQEEKKWPEAERCYRQSVAIKERVGDRHGAATTYHQLGTVAQLADEPERADRWYNRALDLFRQVQPNSADVAGALNNLAGLLADEVHAGRAGRGRLSEARRHAEQALAIWTSLDSSDIWKTWNILAQIAGMEGRQELVRKYRARERETFAAFAGNSHEFDRRFGDLILPLAAAAASNEKARTMIQRDLPHMEAAGWHIQSAAERIFAGERDWEALVEDLDRTSALLVRRVLDVLARPEEAQAIKAAGKPEGDEPAEAPTLEAFDPLLQAIAAIAHGDTTYLTEIEATLAHGETKGWHLQDPARRIWAGERDPHALTERLDEQDAALIQRLLGMIAAKGT